MAVFQISVATGATLITNSRSVGEAAMFCVTSRAIKRRDLRGMMSGAIVAIEAGAIGSFCRKGARLADMAGRALFFEHSMSA